MAFSVNPWHYIRLSAHGNGPARPSGPEGAPRAWMTWHCGEVWKGSGSFASSWFLGLGRKETGRARNMEIYESFALRNLTTKSSWMLRFRKINIEVGEPTVGNFSSFVVHSIFPFPHLSCFLIQGSKTPNNNMKKTRAGKRLRLVPHSSGWGC